MIKDLPQSLIEAASEILHGTLYESIVLLENRIQFLKDKNPDIDTSHDPMAIHKNAGDIIDHISNSADPTPKKTYSQWLVNMYKKGQFKQEDAYKLKGDMDTFSKHNKKLEKTDIGQYKSVDELKGAVAPYHEVAATKKELQKQLQGNAHEPGHELKYEDDNIQIYHLHDKAVAKKLYARKGDQHPGKLCPTEWCTSTEDEKHNMFDYYLSEKHPGSKLHVVHRKSDRAVFQYHPESNQFMDSDDNAISVDDFKSIAPSLHKAWKENPDLI